MRKPEIRDLIKRAIEKIEYPGTTPYDLYGELVRRAPDDDIGIFIGYEEFDDRTTRPMAVVVIVLPTSQAMIAPQGIILYSEGEPALIRSMGARIRSWLGGAGYDRVLGLNLRHSDAAFCRLLGHVGKPEVLGSVVAFRF
jgi:hypothetical protein